MQTNTSETGSKKRKRGLKPRRTIPDNANSSIVAVKTTKANGLAQIAVDAVAIDVDLLEVECPLCNNLCEQNSFTDLSQNPIMKNVVNQYVEVSGWSEQVAGIRKS